MLIKNMLKSIKEHSRQFSKEVWDQIFIEIVHQMKKKDMRNTEFYSTEKSSVAYTELDWIVRPFKMRSVAKQEGKL